MQILSEALINAKLLGTMVSTNDKYSFATVSESGKKEAKNYRIGDLIAGEGKFTRSKETACTSPMLEEKNISKWIVFLSIYKTPQQLLFWAQPCLPGVKSMAIK
jgi:hypothetical protein